jgi:lipopolysaccharide export system permease protein
MLGIKKLDIYILKKFLPLFLGAFFISMFVLMMQFTWRYVDELIGKGLTLDILGQFFWYMGITLVPLSLPLAILLASLITFGNMGEQLELLSMKAAGVPLIRIMRPIMVVVIALTAVAFHFQNNAAPRAQIDLRTLLLSMKQAQPAVEIPEGVFYNDVPGLNLYVQHKNAQTGMLYQVIIYKTDQGFDRAQIVLADSGRLEMSADKLHLTLDLWSGEQFENLQQKNLSVLSAANVPYDRETFDFKHLIIDFDSNFAMMDKELLRDMPSAKDMQQIEHSVDSINAELDSIGLLYLADARKRWYATPQWTKKDSLQLAHTTPVDFRRLEEKASPEQQQAAHRTMSNNIRSIASELQWKSSNAEYGDAMIRRHWVEWHQKIALSLACLFFFFVGAPLGAIIRKGGLGMPAVVAVIVFVIYYSINTMGMKMAREGSWNMVFGMWISTAILVPLGSFLTYKSNHDSVVFNSELYLNLFMRLLGLRTHRHIARKEVIIDVPDYDAILQELAFLRQDCADYARRKSLLTAPHYFRTFFSHVTDKHVEEIERQLEHIVTQLSNSSDRILLGHLNELPIIYAHAHTSPFDKRWLNVVCGIIFPFGLLLWLRIWRFRLRLARDLRQIIKSCDALTADIHRIEHKADADTPREGRSDTATETAADTAATRRPLFRRIRLPRKGWYLLGAFLLAAVLLLGWKAYRGRHPHATTVTPTTTERPDSRQTEGNDHVDAAAQRLFNTTHHEGRNTQDTH